MEFQPARQLLFHRKSFVENARALRKGVAADPRGTRNEHLKVLLDKERSMDRWCNAAAQLASGRIPAAVVGGLVCGRMTALDKGGGRVRGIVTGNVFRRLVARTFSQQSGEAIEATTASFQFALSTRAGTAAMGHFLRTVTDMDKDAVVIAIDGIGAFDHIQRHAIFNKLMSTPDLEALVQFVRLFYGRPPRILVGRR